MWAVIIIAVNQIKNYYGRSYSPWLSLLVNVWLIFVVQECEDNTAWVSDYLGQWGSSLYNCWCSGCLTTGVLPLHSFIKSLYLALGSFGASYKYALLGWHSNCVLPDDRRWWSSSCNVPKSSFRCDIFTCNVFGWLYITLNCFNFVQFTGSPCDVAQTLNTPSCSEYVLSFGPCTTVYGFVLASLMTVANIVTVHTAPLFFSEHVLQYCVPNLLHFDRVLFQSNTWLFALHFLTLFTNLSIMEGIIEFIFWPGATIKE